MQSYSYSLRENAFLHSILVRGYSTVLETVYTLCFRCQSSTAQRWCILFVIFTLYSLQYSCETVGDMSHILQSYSTAQRKFVLCFLWYSFTVQFRDRRVRCFIGYSYIVVQASYSKVLQYSFKTVGFMLHTVQSYSPV